MTYYQTTHNEQKKPNDRPNDQHARQSKSLTSGGACEEALREGLGEGRGRVNRREPIRNGARSSSSSNHNKSSWVPLLRFWFQWQNHRCVETRRAKRLKIWSQFPTAARSSSAHVRPINSPRNQLHPCFSHTRRRARGISRTVFFVCLGFALFRLDTCHHLGL